MHHETFTVFKVGGSLFSDKFSDRLIDHQALNNYVVLMGELHQNHPGQVALMSGGGSYGHQAVREMDPNQAADRLLLTQYNFELKWLWHRAFEQNGIASFPVQMAAQAIYHGQGQVAINPDYFHHLLASGHLPILSGDCLIDNKGQLQLVGSDVMPGFCQALNFQHKRIIIMTDVAGVLEGKGPDSYGATIPVINQHSDLDTLIWPTKFGDTSDQMIGKVNALLQHAQKGIECIIASGNDCLRYRDHLMHPSDQWPSCFKFTQIEWQDATPLQTAGMSPC